MRREGDLSRAENAGERADSKSIPLNTAKKSHGGGKKDSKEGIMLHFRIGSAGESGPSAAIRPCASICLQRKSMEVCFFLDSVSFYSAGHFLREVLLSLAGGLSPRCPSAMGHVEDYSAVKW